MDERERRIESPRGRAALADIGSDRVISEITAGWERAGVDADGCCTWSTDRPRYALELDSPDDPAGLDLFAAVLDAMERVPAQVAVHVERGRRDDLDGGRQDALERLAANPQMTATADHTAGSVPATDNVFDALAWLYGDGLVRAVVADERGETLLDYREHAVVFALSTDTVDRLHSVLDDAIWERIESV